MKIIKYSNFNEALSDDLENKLEQDNNLEIKKVLLDMIENSVNSNDIDVIKKYIKSYISNPDGSTLIGFVNDSDIYDFYIKYIDVIDQVLNKDNYFETPPSENGLLSVYQYVIFSTKKAVSLLLTTIINEI